MRKNSVYFFSTPGSVVWLSLLFNTNAIFIFPHTWNKQIKQDKKWTWTCDFLNFIKQFALIKNYPFLAIYGSTAYFIEISSFSP